jgi:4-hydroxy-tetrahydrodipicolinate synthase
MAEMKFYGTGVALVTPFRKDFSIDFKSLTRITEHVINGSVNFLVVLGTTGESVTLSKDERLAVVNHVIDITEKRIPIVIGIGGNNTQEVVNIIKTTDFTGIDAILSVAPYYNKPGQRGLYGHYKTIASVSPIPIILYNVPGRTGVNISAETTLRLANDFENIQAIKEASGNLEQITYILRDKPTDFTVLSGDDALILPQIAIGVKGVISVVANAFPKEFSEMVNNALNGNYEAARMTHYQMIEIIDTLFIEGNPAGIKAGLRILDLIRSHLRLPLARVGRSTYFKLQKLIEEFQGNN